MKVRDVMESRVVTVKEDATYEEAARVLAENGFSGAPVVDAEARLIGIISEKDLFKAIFPNYSDYYVEPHAVQDYERREETVRDVRAENVQKFMSRKLYTVRPDDPILKAAALMLAKGVFRLPVVEEEKLVGLVTREHIYRNIFRKYFGF